MRNPWTRVAEFALNPDPTGGYRVAREYERPDGVHISDVEWCSPEGLATRALHARSLERFGEALELARQTYPVCVHGINVILDDLEGERFSWDVDPYFEGSGYAERGWPAFMHNGWHADYREFCVHLCAQGLPDGSLMVYAVGEGLQVSHEPVSRRDVLPADWAVRP